MNSIRVPRLVKAEDMNHHGTLYAGRLADWFVEACYICAAQADGLPGIMVCLKIHDLVFKQPCRNGDILFLETRIAKVGTSSLTVYGKTVSRDGRRIHSEGYITFVCVDEQNRPVAHGLSLPPAADAGDEAIRRGAQNF